MRLVRDAKNKRKLTFVGSITCIVKEGAYKFLHLTEFRAQKRLCFLTSPQWMEVRMQVLWMRVASYWLIEYALLNEKGSNHKTRGSPGIAICDNEAIPTWHSCSWPSNCMLIASNVSNTTFAHAQYRLMRVLKTVVNRCVGSKLRFCMLGQKLPAWSSTGLRLPGKRLT